MCIQRTPEPARAPGRQEARKARHRGCVSLVTFFAQAKKVTRSPAGRVEALHSRYKNSKALDSGLTSSAIESWNDDRKEVRNGKANLRPTPYPPNPPLEGEGSSGREDAGCDGWCTPKRPKLSYGSPASKSASASKCVSI